MIGRRRYLLLPFGLPDTYSGIFATQLLVSRFQTARIPKSRLLSDWRRLSDVSSSILWLLFQSFPIPEARTILLHRVAYLNMRLGTQSRNICAYNLWM